MLGEARSQPPFKHTDSFRFGCTASRSIICWFFFSFILLRSGDGGAIRPYSSPYTFLILSQLFEAKRTRNLAHVLDPHRPSSALYFHLGLLAVTACKQLARGLLHLLFRCVNCSWCSLIIPAAAAARIRLPPPFKRPLPQTDRNPPGSIPPSQLQQIALVRHGQPPILRGVNNYYIQPFAFNFSFFLILCSYISYLPRPAHRASAHRNGRLFP